MRFPTLTRAPLTLLSNRSFGTLNNSLKLLVTESAKKIVQTILHGSETQETTESLSKMTHSKLVAKGKYVHELSGRMNS